MKLYNLSGGSNPRRVRIYLAEKGIDVPMVDVDVGNRENSAAEFLAKNPLGKLPVLELDDGRYLCESMAIIRYFEALHPEPPLLGVGADEQAFIEMWNRRAEIELAQPIGNAFMHGHKFWADRLEQVPDFAEFSKRRALATLQWFDKELATRAYLAGDTYTIADISAYAGLLLGKVVGIRPPPELANLTRWYESVAARPGAGA